jgi:hypothetical protein
MATAETHTPIYAPGVVPNVAGSVTPSMIENATIKMDGRPQPQLDSLRHHNVYADNDFSRLESRVVMLEVALSTLTRGLVPPAVSKISTNINGID